MSMSVAVPVSETGTVSVSVAVAGSESVARIRDRVRGAYTDLRTHPYGQACATHLCSGPQAKPEAQVSPHGSPRPGEDD